ncbi:MAG: CsbD family protein [Pseudonocardiaceae bacterium]
MTEELTGKIKSMAGKAVDDEQLEAEGDADQVKGNVKQAGEKVKDVFQD